MHLLAVSEVETIEVVSVTYPAVEATMRHFRYLILVLISTSLGCATSDWESRIDEQLCFEKIQSRVSQSNRGDSGQITTRAVSSHRD